MDLFILIAYTLSYAGSEQSYGEKAERTKEKILCGAYRLFAQKGF